MSRSHRDTIAPVRALAEQAFSRAAGAPLVPGNHIRLLKDARENYPAWLDAIARATRFIHFESYIIHDDAVGAQFSDALIAKARDGVHVRVIYDWMGGFGKTSRRFWNRLRAGGVEVRCYNPPSPTSPLGWLSRDHRKMLAWTERLALSPVSASDRHGSAIPRAALRRGVIRGSRCAGRRCSRSRRHSPRCGL
jgi:cardiolipin synthase